MSTEFRAEICEGGLDMPEVRGLLSTHLGVMQAQTPPESVHALPIDGLRDPAVRFWHMRLAGEVVGVGALKRLADGHGEIKSMHTAKAHRGFGLARRMLEHIVKAARVEAMATLYLETGSSADFAPARALYANHGFRECGPFADYKPDPFSTFMTKDIEALDQVG